MSSEASQIDCDLNIYFIITDKQQSENDCSSDMWHAFNSCNEHELSPKWIKENLCNELEPGKKDVFVLEEFEGPTFEKLTKFKCSIVGPRCLLSCFMTGEPIPEGTSPVFTTAMRGLVVSVSGLSVEAKVQNKRSSRRGLGRSTTPNQVPKNVGQKVEYMGGIFSRQLRSCATHLVANFVMSAKYERAVELGIPIMTEQWITAVWEASLVENVRATSSRFDEYKCAVFMNLVVTSTNLSKRKKGEISKLITDNGGIFMGSLDGTKVKILIAPENSTLSEKLKYALNNNIACVKPEWVDLSVKHGYALPFSEFLIASTKGCSTPEKSHANATLNFSCISTIPGDVQQNGVIEETMMTTMMSTMSQTMQRSPLELKAAYVEVLERLNVHDAKLAGPFLDGCNIYLTGFPLDHREKLIRILNVGSATRLDNISDAVTHVIVGDPIKASAEIKQIKSSGSSPYFLTINWLEESMKMKSTAAEEDFEYGIDEGKSVEKKVEPPSPLSKKNLQLLQISRRPPVPKFNIDKKMDFAKEIDEPDLVQEYRKSNVHSIVEKLPQELPQPPDEPQTPQQSENSNTSNSKGSSFADGVRRVSEFADDTTIPLTQSSEINEHFLEGFTFVLSGFDDPGTSSLIMNIESRGGQIVRNSFKGIPDFGVVPINGAPLKHTVNEIVTDLFIEDCVEQTALVEIEYYHKPVSINVDATPLADCVIAMSSYTGKERTFLSNIAVALGARYQDALARRTNVNRNVYGCTHLVCPTPEGSKYNAAVKWKLPAVKSDWLLACVAQQRRVAETPYLVGETIAGEIPDNIDTTIPKQTNAPNAEMGPPPSDPNTRNIITPKRNLQLLQDSGITPGMAPINKRLSINDYKTPPSPFHISTPETPYGQFLKPNPSPSTRKRWLKWAEDMPDMKCDEPPSKRRAPSTPLSDLKRKMWIQMKEPFSEKNCDEENENENEREAPVRSSGNRYVPTPDLEQNSGTNSSPSVSNTLTKKALSFSEESTTTDQINLQLAQLDQVLQASTPETRHSLSAESAKQAIYDSEPADHMAKCIVKDSQPDTVGWEDPVHTVLRRKSTIPEEPKPEPEDVEEELSPKPNIEEIIQQKPKFMLSGIKDRTAFEKIITALGGEVSMETSFDPTATHLLCFKPGRNEKFLASIAAGKWVLHCLYLTDCEQEGTFLNEEKYEWGNPKSQSIIPQPTTEIERQIAAAAYKWRSKLGDNPGGAFKDMVALLIGPKERCQQFQRLISAGGGTVVEARPPYNTSPKSKKITHCFIQVKQLDQPVDWAMMASKGILCFLPQYLSDHLIAEEPLNPRECVLPEFRKYLSLLPK